MQALTRQNARTEFETSKRSGLRTRQTCGFFTSVPPSMAGRGRIQDPQGKEGHRLRSGFNLLAASISLRPIRLKPEDAEMSTNPPAVFTFTAQAVRVVTDEQGNPWFAVADVCAVLGYANSRDTLAKHCRAGGVAKRDTPTSSGVQPLTFIDEGNLYRLIIKSRKPEAAKFETWVCDKVLPALRKTGQYKVGASETAVPVKLGEIGDWITRQHHQHAARYLYRSSQGVSAAVRAGIEARFGMPARDLPVAMLPELLDTLEHFGDDCYRLWSVCLQLESWLLAQWKQQPDELPPTVKQLMQQVDVPNGPGTVLANIRDNVRAMLPTVTH